MTLRDFFFQNPRAAVAFSGGVDSAVLLWAAKTYGQQVRAYCVRSPFQPVFELEDAKQLADILNVTLTVLEADPLSAPEVAANGPDRCYLCKRNLFRTLMAFAKEKGVEVLAEGTNEDDLHVYRPGIQAVRELGIRSPLAEAGLTKEEVRRLAAACGISAASRPSTPCMATRLPYGARLDYEILKKIEAGEEILRRMIGGNVRLRLHGQVVRIETDPERFSLALEKREEVVRQLKELGFVYITLDLEGFRSGSMDVGLESRGESEVIRQI